MTTKASPTWVGTKGENGRGPADHLIWRLRVVVWWCDGHADGGGYTQLYLCTQILYTYTTAAWLGQIGGQVRYAPPRPTTPAVSLESWNRNLGNLIVRRRVDMDDENQRGRSNGKPLY